MYEMDEETLRRIIKYEPGRFGVACLISRAYFSGQRRYEIETETETGDGGKFIHFAPSHYFWNQYDSPLSGDEPDIDEWISGRVSAGISKVYDDGKICFVLPSAQQFDSFCLRVDLDNIVEVDKLPELAYQRPVGVG